MCIGVSIGGVITAAVIVIVVFLYCKHSKTLKKHDKAIQLPTTVSTQYMIIIIMTHAVHISLFIAGQLC